MSDHNTNPEQRALEMLIADLHAKGELTDPRMETAFRKVPRHLFLPDMPLDTVYSDRAVPTKLGSSGIALSSSSQPSMMLQMLRALEVQPGHNVLEIGTGTGYNAAILTQLVGAKGRVTSVEIDADTARNAQDNLGRARAHSVLVVNDDGARGYGPRADYDRIICTAGIWDIPRAWVQQLKPGGLIVTPLQVDATQVMVTLQVQADGSLYSEHNTPCRFIYMRGIASGPTMNRHVGSSALTLASVHIDRVDTQSLSQLLTDDFEACQLTTALETRDMAWGFQPFVAIHQPATYTFATYLIEQGKQAFGIEGAGFTLFSRGSAAFVPYDRNGYVHCFAGADAYLTLEELLADWLKHGRPQIDRLRLHLIPRDHEKPATTGRVYTRFDHYLNVWMDTEPEVIGDTNDHD